MKLKSFIFLLFCTFGLIACKNGAGPEDSLSLDDVVEGSNKSYTDLSKEELSEEKTSLDETYAAFAAELGESIEQTRVIDSLMFVDRFDTKSSYKYQNDSSKMFVAEWEFANPALAKNAFMNWIQCFGTKCNALAVGDSVGISSEKMAILLSGNELYYFSGIKKEVFKKTVNYLLEEKKIKNIDFALYQNGKKRIDWMKLEDFKEEK